MTFGIRSCHCSSSKALIRSNIQEQAGHSSIQVTMDTYGHPFTNQNREWVNKLDEPAKKPDEKRDGLAVTPVSAVYVPGS